MIQDANKATRFLFGSLCYRLKAGGVFSHHVREFFITESIQKFWILLTFPFFVQYRSYFEYCFFFVININDSVYNRVLIIYNLGPYLKVIGGSLSSTAIGVI